MVKKWLWLYWAYLFLYPWENIMTSVMNILPVPDNISIFNKSRNSKITMVNCNTVCTVHYPPFLPLSSIWFKIEKEYDIDWGNLFKQWQRNYFFMKVVSDSFGQSEGRIFFKVAALWKG